MSGKLHMWSGVGAPLPTDADGSVNALDLVVLLGRIARFGHNGDPEWRVLHHSLLVGLIACRLGYNADVFRYALLHDAHEVYFGADIPSPVKALLGSVVKDVEGHLDTAIRDHLYLPPPTEEQRAAVKRCDRVAGVIESVLFGPVRCDLAALLPDEERPEMVALCERVVPGFQYLVRNRS